MVICLGLLAGNQLRGADERAERLQVTIKEDAQGRPVAIEQFYREGGRRVKHGAQIFYEWDVRRRIVEIFENGTLISSIISRTKGGPASK